MKATFDLPGSLVKKVKRRALHQGRKLNDEVAGLLRAGLAAMGRPIVPPKHLKSPRIKIDRKTGLPFIVCNPTAMAATMTAEQLVAIEQESQTQEDLERLGLSD